ncbi:MAG: lytic transglycosylase, partial [Ewingella sp.]
MKAKAIIFASVLLVGCQASRQDVKVPEQHAQSLSSASQSEAGEYTDGGRLTSSRWLDNDDSIAQKNLWNFIGDELKMKVPENARIREQKVKYLKNKSYLHDVTLRAEPYM